jgi:hypothetical protein
MVAHSWDSVRIPVGSGWIVSSPSLVGVLMDGSDVE